MKTKNLGLGFLWKARLRFRAEGRKLRAEGDKLWAEGDKLWVEGSKLLAEGDKLWAEGVLGIYGNIKLEWKNWNSKKQDYECHLELPNKKIEIYKP